MTASTFTIEHRDFMMTASAFAATVVRTTRITPRMHRVIFTLDRFDAYDSPGVSDDIRIQIPLDFDEIPIPPTIEWAPFRLVYPDGAPESDLRAYTVRKVDRTAEEVWIDFVIHGDGLASRWADQARAGQRINISSPFHSHVLHGQADHYLLIGDETALPAIGRQVEELPAGSRITVVAEVAGATEEQAWTSPSDVGVTWIHRVPGSPKRLEEAVRAVPKPDGVVYAFGAGEAGQLRGIRRYLIDEMMLDRHTCEFGGYWKRPGESDAEVGWFEDEDHDHG